MSSQPISSDIIAKPLASVVLMAYNQERFVREAIQSALNQTYTPLEIIISDDASTDSTWEIIQETINSYRGPHKVYPRRNIENLGINGHFNEFMKLVNGEFIVIMAGDDVSLPERVQTSVDILQNNDVAGFFSNAICIDEYGRNLGLFIDKDSPTARLDLETILQTGGNGGCGFSLAWRRNVKDLFGPIPSRPLGEDAFIPFRCALLCGFMYLNKPLIQYRQHDQNISFWNEINNSSIANTRMETAKKIARHYLAMYEHWNDELDFAHSQQIISEEEYDNAKKILADRIWLQKEREHYLKHSFIMVMRFLFKERQKYARLRIKQAAIKEFTNFLAYAHPVYYKLLRNTYTKLRKSILNAKKLLNCHSIFR